MNKQEVHDEIEGLMRELPARVENNFYKKHKDVAEYILDLASIGWRMSC
jgi:hypothetical protein